MAEVTIKGLGRNSAYAGLSEVWRIGSRIVLTPIILAQIGLVGYGVWTLLFSVCSYVSLMNTSFGLAYVKFTAEHDAERDYRTLSEIIGSGIALVGGIGLVGFAVLWVVRWPLLTVLGVPEAMLPGAVEALFVVALCVLMRMSIGCTFQILAGLQRVDLRYKIGMLGSAIEFALAIVLLYRGWGLLGLATGHLCGQVVGISLAWLLCRRLCPAIRISPRNASLNGLRRILSLGGRFQLLHALMWLSRHGIKLLISALLGVASLATFEIARKLLALGEAVGGTIIAPMMPAFANVHANDAADKKRALYAYGSRVVSTASIISFSFLAVFADRLIVLWTAQEYPLAAWTVRCLAVAFIVKQLTAMGTASLRGEGSVGLEIRYGLVNTILLATLIVPAYLLWGYRGMMLSASTSLIVASTWFLVKFSRWESIPFVYYIRQVLLRPAMILAPVVVVASILEPVLRIQVASLHGRLGVLFDLLVWGGLFGLASALCAWFGVLSKQEREALIGATLRTPLRSAAE